MANRITTPMVYGSMLSSAQANLKTLLDLQRQMTTQNKYSKLSDNPVEIARALSLESSLVANERYTAAHEDSVTMLKHSQNALTAALNIVQTIHEKVVYAGNGALGTSGAAIADEIDQLKQQLVDTLNTRVAGKYLFGGTDTGTAPFQIDQYGNIRYVGSDERIRYEIDQAVLGDVSFTGKELLPNDDKTYFICGHVLPLDWVWTGREEKVMITVGNRTLPIYIPEQWVDEVTTGKTKPTDYNEFRDPQELTGITLDDVATLINRALVEQGVDMLLTATVDKDLDAGLQRLFLKSNTGEPVSIVGWPDTDYLPMPQSVAGNTLPRDGADNVVTPDWSHTMLIGDAAPQFSGLDGKSLIVVSGGVSTTIALTAAQSDAATLLAHLNTHLPLDVRATMQGGKLVLTSSTGETIQVDGTAAQMLFGNVRVSEKPEYNGLMGLVNTLGWRDDGLGKGIRISLNGQNYDFTFAGKRSITELINEINEKVPVGAGDLPVASLVAGRLTLQSTLGPITVTDLGVAGGTAQLFGQDTIGSSTSSLTIKLDEKHPVKVYINSGDDLTKIATRINALEGIYSRTSADEDQLVIVAQRFGQLPPDPLAVSSAQESLHYPPFTVTGEGMAMSLFDFTYTVDPETGLETGVLGSRPKTRPVDHSHMDVFAYLGMETALKSVEFQMGETLKVGELQNPGNPYDPVHNPYVGKVLHWRIMSGGHVTEIKLNPGEYTMEQLADRIRNAGSGWLQATVDVFRTPGVPSEDDHETGLGTSHNEEKATSRLVIQSLDGSPVTFLDMNDQRYAEEMGLANSVRTDPDMGLETIYFPEAPCLDDELAALLRVQMTCGRAFDVRLTREDVIADKATGEVDRVLVMREIARQVNAQAGDELLRVIIPVDDSGKELPDSASLISVSGTPFTIADLPVSDPAWKDYSSGIAAQMGIHSGVTSNLSLVPGAPPGLRDDETIGVTGTIRFESLGQRVEIDVTADDTVKDVMDRLRAQAGDWLYVNYFDRNMGNKAGQAGNYPLISIAAKDGSAVNVLDVKGTVAREKLLLTTGIQGAQPFLQADGTLNPALFWNEGDRPASVLDLSVAGYTHTIDLTAMRDINGNGHMDAEDLVETINARMQDYDVRAELNADGNLVLWSPRGYTVTAQAWRLDLDGVRDADITNVFFGAAGLQTTPYRGGYKLEDPLRTAPGIYTQNTVSRSGANQRRQNFFGVLDDISRAIRSENRKALSNIMLPKIDRFMDGLLRAMSQGGALQTRYEGNISRLKIDNIIMTETYDDLVKIDLSKIPTELMMAQAIYQATLGVMAQVIQPTLLNFLR
ncbi:MAG: flagellar hook-associated protein FlgL [Fretibacterium sp.]|nr:flagellar hook-associated protein FlgL [Fretibacterium sp.]